MYLIKWLGYGEEDNTWESKSNLNCPIIMNRYRARMQYAKKKKQLQDRKNKIHLRKPPSSYKDKRKKITNKEVATKKVATHSLHKQTLKRKCHQRSSTTPLKVRIPLTSLSSPSAVSKETANNEQNASIQCDNVTSSLFPQITCEFAVDSSSCDESFLQDEDYTFPTSSNNPVLEKLLLPWETTSADVPVSVDYCDFKDFFTTDPGEAVIPYYVTTPSVISIEGVDSSNVSVGSPTPPLVDSNFNLTLSPSLSLSSVTSLTTASDVEIVDDATDSVPVVNNNDLQSTKNHTPPDVTPPHVDPGKEHHTPSTPRFRMTMQRAQRRMSMEYPTVTETSVNGLNHSFNNKKSTGHHLEQIRPRRSKDYYQELREWCASLNSKCKGREASILVENIYDKFPIPKYFEYICTNLYGKGVPNPADHEPVTYCKCQKCGIGNAGCCPAQLEALFPYYSNGRIRVAPGKPIYECNSACDCGPECCNRVVQKLRSIPLCIFRTGDAKGWGVKAVTEIKKNSFVCEYTGEVIMFDEAERRGAVANAKGLTYIFDLDFHSEDDGCCFSIDASKYGNISHFFNHSVS